MANILDGHHSLGRAELLLAWLFYGKVRKFSGLAATSHPMHVAQLVAEPGGNDLRGMAHTLFMAILHDIPEDATALGFSLSPAQVVQSLWSPPCSHPKSWWSDPEIIPNMVSVLDTLTDDSGLKGHKRLFAQMEKVLDLHKRDPVLGLVAFLLRGCDKLSSYGTDHRVVEAERWPMDPETPGGQQKIGAYLDDMSVRAGILEVGWNVIKERYRDQELRFFQERVLLEQIGRLVDKNHGVLGNLRTDLLIMLAGAGVENPPFGVYDWREVYRAARHRTIGGSTHHPLNKCQRGGYGTGYVPTAYCP